MYSGQYDRIISSSTSSIDGSTIGGIPLCKFRLPFKEEQAVDLGKYIYNREERAPMCDCRCRMC
jgi:hypothetical protein